MSVIGAGAESRSKRVSRPREAAGELVLAALLLVVAGEVFHSAPAPEKPVPAAVAPPSADAGTTTLASNDSEHFNRRATSKLAL